ncbi:hypothetical protein EDC04DRAFT_3101015 [Pisolithus marmoratus]|nr:hypothetical protein EDC04DRAFT_3101015 [Pisolithus marmoratus]
MAAPDAQIRPYELKDEKVVKFAIGKALMEELTVANRRAVFHPFTLSIWVALSCIMIEYLGWWPNPEHGLWRFFSPMPAFACWAAPILALIDWFNRPYFENTVSDVLHRLDVANIEEYYARSPSSGFFVLEYDGSVIGLIAIDASEDSQSNQSFKENKVKGQKMGTSSVATIRHLYVDELFRRADVQDDLVAFAVRHAFDASGDVKEIRVVTSSLLGYVQESLGKFKFKMDGTTRIKLGVYGWTTGVMNLKRVDWEKEKLASTNY